MSNYWNNFYHNTDLLRVKMSCVTRALSKKNISYFELSRHEVVDDGVDGGVEVAHAVRDDAPVDQEDHHLLVGRRSLC